MFAACVVGDRVTSRICLASLLRDEYQYLNVTSRQSCHGWFESGSSLGFQSEKYVIGQDYTFCYCSRFITSMTSKHSLLPHLVSISR